MSIVGDGEFDPRHLDAIADADPYPYWLEDADEPDTNPTVMRRADPPAASRIPSFLKASHWAMNRLSCIIFLKVVAELRSAP